MLLCLISEQYGYEKPREEVELAMEIKPLHSLIVLTMSGIRKTCIEQVDETSLVYR